MRYFPSIQNFNFVNFLNFFTIKRKMFDTLEDEERWKKL